MRTVFRVSNLTDFRNALDVVNANSDPNAAFEIILLGDITWSSSITNWPEYYLRNLTIYGQGRKIGTLGSTYTINAPLFGMMENCQVRDVVFYNVKVQPSIPKGLCGVLASTATNCQFINLDFLGCSVQAESSGIIAGWLDNSSVKLVKFHTLENRLNVLSSAEAFLGGVSAVATPPVTIQDVELKSGTLNAYLPLTQAGSFGGVFGAVASRGGTVRLERIVTDFQVVQPTINTAYSRSGVSYFPNGVIAEANTPRIMASERGYAILIEPSGNNMISNALGVDFLSRSLDGADTRLTMVSGAGLNGTNVRQAVKTSNMTGSWISASQLLNTAISPGQVYTLSAYVRAYGDSAVGRELYLAYHDGQTTWRQASGVQLTTQWQRVKYTFTVERSNNSIEVAFNLPVENIATDEGFEVCMPQLEQNWDATTFMDPTRPSETLSLNISEVLSPDAGTIDVLFYHSPLVRQTTTERYLFATGQSSSSPWKGVLALAHVGNVNNGGFALWLTNGTGSSNTFANDTNSVTIFAEDNLVYGWHIATAKWDNANVYLYIDGQLVGTGQKKFVTNWLSGQRIYIGSAFDGTKQLTSMIAMVRFSKYARSDDEIVQSMLDGLLVDSNGVSRLEFDANKVSVVQKTVSLDGFIGRILEV